MYIIVTSYKPNDLKILPHMIKRTIKDLKVEYNRISDNLNVNHDDLLYPN